MKQFLSFVRKEFIHILRDPRTLLVLLVMPQAMVMILGYLIRNDVTDIRVAILDHSKDVITTQITQRLASNNYFILCDELQTEAEATELFRKGEIDLVVVYGNRFADRLLHSQDAVIQLLADGSEPNQASMRVTYAQQVIMTAQKELAAKVSNRTNNHVSPKRISVNTRMLFNPQQRSEMNFVPGVVGIIMLLICCMMTSVAIVREREMGTMEILLASPLSVINIVLAKLTPYFAISLFNLATLLCLTTWVMDVPMAGSLLLYIFMSLLYVFVVLMLGLFISCVVSTQLAALLLSLLMIVPSLYFSDMIFPLASMPEAAQVVSNIVPARWFISASRKIMIEGLGLPYVVKEMGVLILQGVLLMLLSWKLFKTRLE